MRFTVPTISFLAVCGITTATAAAATPVALPAWCGRLGQRSVGWPEEETALAATSPREAIPHLVGAMCGQGSSAAKQPAKLEAARRSWMARLELTDAEWDDAIEFAVLPQATRNSGEVALRGDADDPASRKRAWSGLDAIDQHAILATRIGASGSLTLDHSYLADALGSKLSEAGRLAYVRDCLTDRRGPVDWAMCQGDIDRLDLHKLASELRANQAYSGGDKMLIRIAAFELTPLLAQHAAKLSKLVASDPGYARLFAVAKAAWEDGAARERADASLLALVGAMDDARATGSRKAFAGCEDRTWAAWRAAVATIPAKQFEGMHDNRERGVRFVDAAMAPIVGSPSAYLASVALVTCMTVGQPRDARPDVLIRMLGGALARWPGFRGPRTAAETAILLAGVTLDDRDAKLDYPEVDRPFGGFGGTTSSAGAGVVAALRPSGKTTTVELKKQMVRQIQCAETRETNRIVQIRNDGTLIRAITCVRNETVVVDKADRPQQVNPRYLDGVKPGVFVTVTEDVAVAAWAKPGASIPSHVFGVAVK